MGSYRSVADKRVMVERAFKILILTALTPFLFSCGRIWGGVNWANQIISVSVATDYSNGAQWLSFIKNDGANIFSASNTACAGTEVGLNACLHGGELLKFVVPGLSSCSGLTAADSLGAFNWVCEQTGSSVTFYSTGLNTNMGLGNLLNSSSFIPNSVTVTQNGNTVAQSSPSIWWTNTIAALPPSPVVQNLNGAPGTIYVQASSTTGNGYNLVSSQIALVILSGATFTYAGGGINCDTANGLNDGGNNTRCMVSVGTQKFVWVEGNFNGGAGTQPGIGIYFKNTSFSNIHSLTMRNITGIIASDGSGVAINSSNSLSIRNVRINGTTATGNGGAGFYVNTSLYSNFISIYAHSCDDDMYAINITQSLFNNIYIADSPATHNFADPVFQNLTNVVIYNTVVNNVNDYTLRVSGSNNVVANILLTASVAAELQGSQNTVLNMTGINDSGGAINLFGSTANYTFSNILLINNNTEDFYDNSSTGGSHIIANLVSTSGSINLNGAQNDMFTGLLLVGSCSVAGGTNPGLVNGTCANQGASNATLISGVNTNNSLVGKVTSTDPDNANNALGLEAYPFSDWFDFSNPFRAWGLDGGAFPAGSNEGICNGGTCRIWDFRLSASDTVVRNTSGNGVSQNAAFVGDGVTACPSAVDASVAANVLTDQQTPSHTYLINAVEILNDPIRNPNGNNNGLCETGEGCIYSPNFGYYQGDGNLSSGTCRFNNGASVQNVKMYGYSNNGG
jgi:hypothetical protein